MKWNRNYEKVLDMFSNFSYREYLLSLTLIVFVLINVWIFKNNSSRIMCYNNR